MKYGAVNIIELLIKYRTVLPDCVDHTRPMVWESTYRKSILAHFFHATLYLQSSEKYPKVQHSPSKVWEETAYPFPNVGRCAVEVWEWISN